MVKDIIHEVITCKDCGLKFTLNGEKEYFKSRKNIESKDTIMTLMADIYINNRFKRLPNKCFECRHQHNKVLTLSKREY